MGHVKRIFMLAYLVGFALVDATTTLFVQYPALKWLGLVVVLGILVETVRCAHYHYQELRDEGVSLST